MKDNIREWLISHKVNLQVDRILVGVSGGADSVCLLCLLAELRQESGVEVHALHVHHGIRGEEADQDAAFVEALCQGLDVPCQVVYQDIPRLAAQNHCSEEEMGRKVRYEALEHYSREHNCQWIAVAHNKEDNAETMLLNLCRGTGLAGLTGIPAVRGKIIRPLLTSSRQEIEGWLKGRGQSWRNDRTNGEEDYTRNRIRHQVLPLLVESINHQAVEHIVEAAERLQGIRDYLEGQIEEQMKGFQAGNSGDSTWLETDFTACAPALQPEVILAWMKRISGKAADFGAEHIKAVGELFGRSVGKEVHLPHGLVARRTYDGVVMTKPRSEGLQDQKQDGQQQAGSDRQGQAPEMKTTLWDLAAENRKIQTVSKEGILFADGKIVKFPESSCMKWFDYDKIKSTLAIRTRKPGDTLVIHPDGSTKKLKSYWIDRKLPQEERDGKWLLADGSDILWILGDRTGEGCRIDANTRRILQVQIIDGGKEHGRQD